MRYYLLAAVCLSPFAFPAFASAQSQSTATNQVPPSSKVAPSPPAADANAPGHASGGVEEIVVTAQRRTERLQNVPVAVTAVSAARLEAVGISTTQDLSQVTPGLSAPQTAGYSQPHIRGVGSSTNGPGLEQPVATYVDGVYIAAAPASLMTLNNIDRLEVLKGPQGTLFGRNATGGLIQVVTKDPKDELSGAANLSYANYNDVVGDLYVTDGLAQNLAADAALRFEYQGDGWGRNLNTGHRTEDLPHDFAGRTKFLYRPSTDTQIRLAIDYEDRISRQDTQHLDQQYPGTFNNALFGGPFNLGGSYDINDNIDPKTSLKSGGVSLQINQTLGPVALESITAFRASQFSFNLDVDLTPVPIQQVPSTSRDDQFSQELQVSSTGAGKLKWVAGLYYFDANDRWSPISILFGPTFISPVPGVPTAINIEDREGTQSVAGYAQGSYEVLPQTHLTFGARYTYEKKDVSGGENFLVGDDLASSTAVPQPGLGIKPSINFNNFSYRVSLDHQFGRDILAYASYNTGFKSGGYNLADPTNAPYRPEIIDATEVGLKNELFDHHLRLNGAAFYYDYSEIQVGRYLNGTEAIYNGAQAEIYGLDLDGELVVIRGLTLDGGFSYDHARFTDFPDADHILPIDGCTPALGGVCPGSAKGDTLPYTPTTTFNVGVTYSKATEYGNFVFNSTYYRTGRFFAAPDNVGYQPAYDIVNASLTWTKPGGRLSFKAFAKNIGNSLYATSLVEAGQGLVRELGAPRTYGGTLGYKF